jgi:hypothetical protein
MQMLVFDDMQALIAWCEIDCKLDGGCSDLSVPVVCCWHGMSWTATQPLAVDRLVSLLLWCMDAEQACHKEDRSCTP